MHLQRSIDLTEPLGCGLAELLNELREPLDIGAHARLHLLESLVDELPLPGERRIVGLAMSPQLLAAHGDGLLDCESGSLTDDLGRDRRRDGWNGGRPGAAGDEPCHRGHGGREADDECDLHGPHHDEGVLHGSRMGPVVPGRPGQPGKSVFSPVRTWAAQRPSSAVRASWGPSSTMRPPSSTTIRSASRIVVRRWAITSAVRPSNASSNAACTWASFSLSRWLVASSRMIITGFLSNSRAMASRCFSPPLRR